MVPESRHAKADEAESKRPICQRTWRFQEDVAERQRLGEVRTVGQGSGVRFFEIGRDRAGFKNETPSGQFRKTEHLTPDESIDKRSAKAR
jgi:hypothetical protein